MLYTLKEKNYFIIRKDINLKLKNEDGDTTYEFTVKEVVNTFKYYYNNIIK